MADKPFTLDHLFPKKTSKSEKFTYPTGGTPPEVPKVSRELHGRRLLRQLERTASHSESPSPRDGTYLEFQSAPGYPLKIESLESLHDSRELLFVKKELVDGKEVTKATVYVDKKKLPKLKKKIDDYLTKVDKRSGKPRNNDFVQSISNISEPMSIRSLWTDNSSFPPSDENIVWEAWLAVGDSDAERELIYSTFNAVTTKAGLQTGSKPILFPENTVAVVRATATQLNEIVFPTKVLAELRRAASDVRFFLGLSPNDEAEWVNDAAKRIIPPGSDAPAVCLLDTGVNNQHPLLIPLLADADMDAYDRENWLTSDHHGHGTGMAGLSGYGDLSNLLGSTANFELVHRLESVKLIPPNGIIQLEEYAPMTFECAYRAELLAPDRERVFCLAVTQPNSNELGRATLWSSTIDGIAVASLDETLPRRLFFLAAGNMDRREFSNYPFSNAAFPAQDPSQSWNALTVGAYTEKGSILPEESYPDASPLAPIGLLSPHSRTSIGWEDEWPNKPDIVLEGGNLAVSSSQDPFDVKSLQLLTTNHEFHTQMLRNFGATSAATAQGARMAAIIMAKYPNLWPETVRALLVHSAHWTPQMLEEYRNERKRNLLRSYGYGVPDLNRALHSANNSLTLVIEDEIQPFIKDKGDARANEMHLHKIPWPEEVLTQLGDLEVRMRVTLSYFIEPNPSRNSYRAKHKYASHQLRFSTIKPHESEDIFRKRINKAAREEDDIIEGGVDKGWLIGEKLRSRGCVHSDLWTGTAIELARKNFVSVFPISGWWKDLKRQARWNSIARYSLVVTLETDEAEVNIYNAVRNQISVPIEIK